VAPAPRTPRKVLTCHSSRFLLARSKARTVNFGLRGVFEREFWTNTPGELALVWDHKGER
jgi:hypothetical protein